MELQNKILAIMVLGTLMGALDTTIVLLALPTMTSSLSTTLASSIWVILIYLLVIAVSTTQLGRVGDIYGRGKIFNVGFVVFTIGSALCGLSPSIEFLIGFRALQAFGGALMQANMGAIVADTFEPPVSPKRRRVTESSANPDMPVFAFFRNDRHYIVRIVNNGNQ